MRWPLVVRAGQTNAGDWWRPFFVSDTSGFVLLVEDWVVYDDQPEGGGTGASSTSRCAAIAGRA